MDSPNPANVEAGHCSFSNCCKRLESYEDDGPLWGDSDEEQPRSAVTDLDREWKSRRDQFYNHGYREGISAGQNDSAQEGFNDGFKDSVLDGQRWGLVRGVTSALAFLPDQLREKMVESYETRKELKSLHESVHSISTEGALKLFCNEFQSRKKSTGVNEEGKQQQHQRRFDLYELEDQRRDEPNSLGDYYQKMESLVQQCPKISSHLDKVPLSV